MRHLLQRSLLSSAVFFAAALPAAASSLTYIIDITAGPASNPAATASYTLTFDPSVQTDDEASGLVLNSYSGFNGSIPAGYDYTPSNSAYVSLRDSIEIGGLAGGVDYVGPDDYRFDISNLTTAPTFAGFSVDDKSGNYVFTSTGTVRITQVLPAAITPEPASLALLGTGTLGLLGIARRRLSGNA